MHPYQAVGPYGHLPCAPLFVGGDLLACDCGCMCERVLVLPLNARGDPIAALV